MKKIVIALTVMIGVGAQANAQGLLKNVLSNLSGGLKAEANSSNFILSDMAGVKSNMGIGGNFGTFIKYRISPHFAIQEDILFTYRVSSLEQGSVKQDYQYFGAEIPIYAMGQWKTKSGGLFYVGAGPYAGMGFSAKSKSNNSEINLYKKDEAGDALMKKMDLGVGGLIGYEFRNRLQVNISYKAGLTNMLDAAKNNGAMHPGAFSLGIGYHFGSK